MLGFLPGEIPLLSATDGGVPPPPPDRVFRFTENAAPPQPSAFEEVQPLPTLRRTANPCSDFSATAEPVRRGRPSQPPRLVRASDTTALLTLSDGRMSLVDDSSAREVSKTSTLATSSVFRAADGTFWFGGTTGQIWSGELVGTELRDITYHGSPRPYLIRHLSGGMVDGEMELFYLDGGTGWVRKHGASHTVLQDGPLGFNGGVVWLGPGHALMAHDRSTMVFEYTDGEVGMITPSGDPRPLTGLNEVEGVGVFALGFEGEILFQDADGSFEAFGSSGIALNSLVVARFEDRILVGAAKGWMVYPVARERSAAAQALIDHLLSNRDIQST